jgi:hypothetical protein
MSQISESDIQHQANKLLHDLVGSATRPPLNRVTMLAITLLGLGLSLIPAPGAGIVGTLAAVGVNLSSGFIWDFLNGFLRRGEKQPDLHDALAAIAAMGEDERRRLEDLADRLDLLRNLLREMFDQQRVDLLDGFATMLQTWGDTLPIQELRDTLAELIRQTTCIQAMREQLDGVAGQMVRIEDLVTELAGLRRLVESLIAQQQAALTGRPSHRKRDPISYPDIMGRVKTIIADELSSAFNEM